MDLSAAQNLMEQYVKDLIDTCPHCGAKVHIEKLWNAHHSFDNGDVEFYVIFRCRPCKKLLLKTYIFRQNRYTNKTELEAVGWDEKYPVSLDTELSKIDLQYIPEEIFTDYKEALKCKSIGANRASCAMFRRALQSALVDLGASESDDLINQIDKLTTLPKDIKDWTHQIRIFGNWGAHPDKDKLKEVDAEEVAEAHDFISKFFVYMFIMPRKVEESRKRREEKTKPKEADDNSK